MTIVRKKKLNGQVVFLRYFADLELHVAESDVKEATEGQRGAGHTLYDQCRDPVAGSDSSVGDPGHLWSAHDHYHMTFFGIKSF